jgi:hypothetical protein
VVAPSFYHVDEQHHLIVINKPIEEVLVAGTESSELVLDKEYSLVGSGQLASTANTYMVEHANTTYTVYFTKLPIATITTKYAIVDSPSVYATFTLAEADGTITNSSLGIEVRGGNSQSYPKKSYELSFWADTLGATNRDVQLLGMRTDNKWNLQALFNEPMRANSKVANELWQDMSHLYYQDKEPAAKNGIAMRYVELFINNEYKGIYTLGERIDKKQLKLKKYTNTIKGELYKGAYWDGAVLFTSLPNYDNKSPYWGGFEYKHPEEYTDWKNLYDFVRFVETSSDAEFVKQYQSKFDLQNAVDYYIFMNVLRAGDNYGKNLYIAKYNAGEPYFYMPWDLDAVFGNNWMGLNDNTTNDILTNGFYKRLNQDCSPLGFRSVLARRWTELRATILTTDYIMAKFEANNTYLRTNGVYEREHAVWSGYSYNAKQLDYTANWLARRLAYLDGVFNQQCSLLSATTSKPASPAVQCYPNPATDYLTVEATAATYEVSIQDVSGRVALQATARTPVSCLDISRLPKGLYLVLVKGENFVATEKLVRN